MPRLCTVTVFIVLLLTGHEYAAASCSDLHTLQQTAFVALEKCISISNSCQQAICYCDEYWPPVLTLDDCLGAFQEADGKHMALHCAFAATCRASNSSASPVTTSTTLTPSSPPTPIQTLLSITTFTDKISQSTSTANPTPSSTPASLVVKPLESGADDFLGGSVAWCLCAGFLGAVVLFV